MKVHEGDMEQAQAAEAQSNQELFQTVFRPVFMISKCLAFSPATAQLPYDRKQMPWRIFSTCYTGFLILFITSNVIRMIPGFLEEEQNYEFYLRLSMFVWFSRCLTQSFYMISILTRPDGQSSKLEIIIKQLDGDINEDDVRDNKKAVERYKRRTRITFSIMMAFIITSIVSIFVALLVGSKARLIVQTAFYPFQDALPLKLIFACMNTYLNVAWILPILMYSLVCESLVMKITLFENRLISLSDCLSVHKNINAVRQMYLKLTDQVGKLDNLLGPIVMFLYIFDIALFSLNLYISIFVAKTALEQFIVWFWISGSLMNLLLVSFDASRIVEKGREVIELLQRLETADADAKSNAELSLLLFHLSGEPIVMTIWKLIPLYKSIIVSVFISLITYFTLLLQFK